MLTKDLLRVSRAGGGYEPAFVDGGRRALAEEVIERHRAHVGEPRSRLGEALSELEAEADFKLVRGLSALVEREATFETRAPLDPVRARRAAFEAAESVGVSTTAERERALSIAADGLHTTADDVEESLFADLDERQVLSELTVPWTPDELLTRYNLSLAQTALFDATEVRVRSTNVRELVSSAKRLRLMYEVVRTNDGRELVLTGPDAIFRATRRYGTRFARLLRFVVGANEWSLVATIADRGTDREMRLSHEDPLRVPDAETCADDGFDSGVEADFAARFSAIDLDWDLTREPEPLETGARLMIPDFAFDYRFDDFRVFFEIMGFWTPEYVEKKLGQLERVEDVELIVAVDDSLGVGEEIEALDIRAIPYTGTVRVKDVVDALRRYEERLEERAARSVPDELTPGSDVVSLSSLAARYGASEAVLEERTFPEHERVGRTLVRPSVLSAIAGSLEPGIALSDVEAILDDHGVDDVSATLSRLGYVVEWEGLSGGTVRERG